MHSWNAQIGAFEKINNREININCEGQVISSDQKKTKKCDVFVNKRVPALRTDFYQINHLKSIEPSSLMFKETSSNLNIHYSAEEVEVNNDSLFSMHNIYSAFVNPMNMLIKLFENSDSKVNLE